MAAKNLWRRGRLAAARSLPGILVRIPEAWGRESCARIGRVSHALIARDRRLARANLSRVHPDWDEARVRAEARRVFEEIGRNAYDFLRYPELTPERRSRLVSFTGIETLDALRRSGTGGVLVTAHLGCWEVLAAALAHRGYPLRALARPLREAALDRAVTAHRHRMGIAVIPTTARPTAAIRHLRSGGFVGVLADQRVRRAGVVVDFLGQPTRMTEAPARYARAGRVPLVPVGIHREPTGTHRITVLDPVAADADSARVTQDVASRLERLIRRHPEQWMWIHPRWEERSPPPKMVFSLTSANSGRPPAAKRSGSADNRERGRAWASASR